MVAVESRLRFPGTEAFVAIGICAAIVGGLYGFARTSDDTIEPTSTVAADVDAAPQAGNASDAPTIEGTSDDLGLGMLQNGHHAEMEYKPLNATDQAAVDALLAANQPVIDQYPTLGDAIAAGFKRAGPYVPGLGIHYTAPWAVQGLNPDGVMDANDMAHPMIVLYDGTEPSAKIAGFMYYSIAAEEPQGFPGTNDFWHYHTNTCTVPAADGIDAPFGADRAVDPADCEAVGGVLMPKTQWMVHVWNVPGYEMTPADGGVFGEANPALKCPDGTYYIMPDDQWRNHPLNVCRSELS
jgi:hypothetical protein